MVWKTGHKERLPFSIFGVIALTESDAEYFGGLFRILAVSLFCRSVIHKHRKDFGNVFVLLPHQM